MVSASNFNLLKSTLKWNSIYTLFSPSIFFLTVGTGMRFGEQRIPNLEGNNIVRKGKPIRIFSSNARIVHPKGKTMRIRELD